MTMPQQSKPVVSPFPLVGSDASELAGLVAILRRLAIARSLPEIMQITTQAARAILRADGITFVLRDGDLCYYAEEDAISPLWKGHRFQLDACISGWCMIEGKAAVIPDIYQDPRIPLDAYRPTFVRSLAMVPVRLEEPIAAMGAYWSQRTDPTPAVLEVLQTIANAAALAVAFVQLQLQHQNAGQADNRHETASVIWNAQNLMTDSGRAFATGLDLAPAIARDLDGRIHFWSGTMERVYGWSRGEAVGLISHDLLKTEFPTSRSEIEAELLDTGHWEGELNHRTRDGRPVTVASHWVLHKEVGQPSWVIEVNNDISALKAVETELHQAKRTAENVAQSKGRLLAAVGHDLKQPLTVIRMVLQILGPQLGAPNQQELLARGERCCDTLATALDSLLEAARLESGGVMPRIEAFPIQRSLDEIKQQFELLAARKGLVLEVVPSNARVRSDPRMLGSILQNLVGNALKYTERGSVSVSCEDQDGILLVQVRDTGIGIPADKLDLVFSEFQRVATGDYEGLGLGLAIVRRTAEVLGHRLRVQSSLGEGSMFGIDLPLDYPL
jgi:PAS domain S-box-containing protein